MPNEVFHGKKAGYLHQDFRFFHIADQTERTFEYHYHEFNKIIVFLSGNVTYLIEGKAYHLKPWDILLINNHDVHKPIINARETYDRVILWVNREFLSSFRTDTYDLTTCFQLEERKSFNLIRLDSKLHQQLQSIIYQLEEACNSTAYAHELFTQSLFLQFMIYLNRIHLDNTYIYDHNSLDYDEQIVDILNYIKTNLAKPLSVDDIAKEFYISKHYLMHKFKRKTGYTLHNYIMNRRLFLAIEYMKQGYSIMESSTLCGFSDYSTFSRLFKKTFHCTPREFLNQ